jgi:RNA polymerase sigma-70 factor (ECF subfamily)
MVNKRFWKLLKPIHDEAVAFCRKLTGDRDDGNDLYQEALLQAARKFGSLKDESAFRPWLYRILVNRFKNRQRNRWRKRRLELSDESIVAACSRDPRDEQETLRRLNAILSVLKPEERSLVVLHEIEGRPLAELAEIFNRPEGTIKTRLFRARRKMYKTVAGQIPKTGPNSVSEAIYAMPRYKKPNS